MGKDLRGKECGKGIYQRKDGRYYARYQDEDGMDVCRQTTHLSTTLVSSPDISLPMLNNK